MEQVKKRQKEMTLEEKVELEEEKVEHEKVELEQKTQMSNQLELETLKAEMLREAIQKQVMEEEQTIQVEWMEELNEEEEVTSMLKPSMKIQQIQDKENAIETFDHLTIILLSSHYEASSSHLESKKHVLFHE